MSCQFCGKRSDCKEICKEVEKLLPKPRSGGHRKEFACDPFKIEGLAADSAFKIKYGNRYNQVEKHKRHNREAGE
jgi:hypothetical protein